MAESDALERLVGFGRELRRRGFVVGTGRIMTFCHAAVALSPLQREDLYWAARSALISRPEDAEAFDAAFDEWFRDETGLPPIELNIPAPHDEETEPASNVGMETEVESGTTASAWRSAEEGDEVEGETALRLIASGLEVLRAKSFADLNEEERRRAAELIRELAVAVPLRRTRRMRPAASGPRFDVPRTIRRSMRTQGEPFHRAWRARGSRARPLVLVLDVSGSMAPYSRALMQFAWAAMAAGRRVETFCFGTRLTRVTRTLKTKDPDRAMHEVGKKVEDWEGGTRIGASLKELLDEWSPRTALRGAVVVLCSDGLERGDPALLEAQMARLHRLAHKVVWVNPLKGSPRYEPLARGMAAALRSVDVFLPGHNLESLEALGKILAG
jgi:uncharacterized protein